MLGRLYIVATPIGNLEDMVPRAVSILQQVDLIAAEDTRHSKKLLQHFAITTPLKAYHDFNDHKASDWFIEQLQGGKDIALISDAGTPLISDPGYRLVAAARAKGVTVSPIPGACALIAALSASGLPTDKFTFEGFLPAKQVAREKALRLLVSQTQTLIFYEAPHRIEECLADMLLVFGEQRQVVIAREVTKHFETITSLPLVEMLAFVRGDNHQQRGEIVLLLAGASDVVVQEVDVEVLRVAKLLREELPPKKAAALTAQITGANKKQVYQALVVE